MLNSIDVNVGAEYLTTGTGKYVGLVFLVFFGVVIIVWRRKRIKKKARKIVRNVKDDLKNVASDIEDKLK